MRGKQPPATVIDSIKFIFCYSGDDKKENKSSPKDAAKTEFTSQLTDRLRGCVDLVRLDVVVLEGVEFVVDERCLVAQQFDLALVGLEVVQRVLDLLQFGVHVALSVVDDAAETRKCAREFPKT